MSISSTNSRTDAVGNNTTAVYPYTFKIFDEDHLLVTQETDLGVISELVLNTDYTVSGVNEPSGGTVTLLAGNLPTDYKLSIRRRVDLVQPADIRNQGDFFASVHEDEFDRLVMADQQQQDELDRSLKLPETEAGSAAATTLPNSEDRINSFLAFDASGNPIASAGISSAPVSAFMATVLDDTSGSAALTTLRNDLAAETAPAVDDELFLRDTSAVAVDRITLENVLKVVNGLTAKATPLIADLVLLYDTAAAAAKKLSLSDLFKSINGLTEDAAPDNGADFVVTYDTSAGSAKKVRPSALSGLGNALRQGLVVKVNASNPNFQVDIDADLLSVQGLPVSSVNLTADITASGANGLDTGIEAISTWYAIHVITNDSGSLVASLLSTSASSPTLPVGYTKSRRVGYVRNNASSNFVAFYQDGDLVTYNDRAANAFYVPTGAGTTDTTQSVAAYVPPGATTAIFDAGVGVNSTSTAGATPAASFQFRTDSSAARQTVVGASDFNSAGGSLAEGFCSSIFFRVTSSRDIDVRFYMQGNNQGGGGSLYAAGYKEVL